MDGEPIDEDKELEAQERRTWRQLEMNQNLVLATAGAIGSAIKRFHAATPSDPREAAATVLMISHAVAQNARASLAFFPRFSSKARRKVVTKREIVITRLPDRPMPQLSEGAMDSDEYSPTPIDIDELGDPMDEIDREILRAVGDEE